MAETLAFPGKDPKAERAEYTLFLHRLADKADGIARSFFASPLQMEFKTDNSPVTQADKEIEMALVEDIRNHYPEHGIFGEESGKLNEGAPWQWVIDPIDGTKAFIAGKPTFTTLIALCFEGKPLLGLISQPIKQERWLGGDGSTPSAAPDLPAETLADAHIATTSMTYFGAGEMKTFRNLEANVSTTLMNHDGYAYAMVADGRLDIALDVKLKPYDFAALVPVIESTGGVITDWDGKPVTLQSDGRILAARTEALHAAALEILTV